MKLFYGIGLLLLNSVALGQTVLLEIDSTQFPGEIGEVVRRLDDIDGDGVPDIISSSHSSGVPGTRGHVQAFSGATGDLIYTVYPGSNLYVNRTLTVHSDMNQDGVSDWSMVWSGTSGGSVGGFVIAYSGLDGRVLYAVRGGSGMQAFASPVTPLQDWNGDGVADWTVTNLQREVLIRSGQDGALIRTIANPASSPYHIGNVHGAGDWDGDQLEDLWVWDMTAPAKVKLHSGDPLAGILRTIDLPTSAAAYSPHYVEGGLGDWDGDGFDDLGGRIHGPPAVFNVLSSLDGSLIAELTDIPTYDLGDINGDGTKDTGTFKDLAVRVFEGARGVKFSCNLRAMATGDPWLPMAITTGMDSMII